MLHLTAGGPGIHRASTDVLRLIATAIVIVSDKTDLHIRTSRRQGDP
jgi:hypothetical protein